MFEQKTQPLASSAVFRARLLRFFLAAFAMTALWLAVGVTGYRFIAGLEWLDAFYNSAMIVSAMGPVFKMHTPAQKIFEALYALFSGLIFTFAVSIAFVPIIHRLFHLFHLEQGTETDDT